MTKITKIMAAGTIALTVLPMAASAHGFGVSAKTENRGAIRAMFAHTINDNDNDNDGGRMDFRVGQRMLTGTVTAVGTNSLTVTGSDGKTYTVDTTNAKIEQPFTGNIALSAIKVNDKVQVIGTVDTTANSTTTTTTNTITAKLVLDMPANTHPAMTTGTVTAVNGNTITVQNTHTGVVSNVTVNTNANTQVTSNGQPSTTAAVTVGSKVTVKGLWDETLNVLNAIKINIHNMFTK